MNDQADRLRQHVNPDYHKARTIAVISGKGGVGKSNTALNFSIELQKRGKKVLLFDLDVGMGNIDILLGKDSSHTIVDLFNDFMPIHDMIESGPKGLSFIAGGSSLNDLVQFDENRINFFFEQYELLARDYDYIIFDMGAGATESSLAFVLASDECIVVTTPEPTAITDAYSMIKQVLARRDDMPLSVVMNRCDSIKEGNKSLLRFQKVVKQFLHKEIGSLGVLPNDKIVHTAVIRQTPYTLLNKHAAISKAIQAMAAAFEKEGESEAVQTEFTFVKKLKGLLKVRKP